MSSIVLIGPICSGKSTVSSMLSNMLNIPLCCMDDVRFTYYEEIGFSKQKQEEIRKQKGFKGVYKYWKPFEAHAVKRVLEDFPGHIHDFGAGHSVHDEQRAASIVKKALRSANVFLLLPSPNVETSQTILRQRLSHITKDSDVLNLNDHFVEHSINQELADHIIYTNNKSVQAVGMEIKKRLQNF